MFRLLSSANEQEEETPKNSRMKGTQNVKSRYQLLRVAELFITAALHTHNLLISCRYMGRFFLVAHFIAFGGIFIYGSVSEALSTHSHTHYRALRHLFTYNYVRKGKTTSRPHLFQHF